MQFSEIEKYNSRSLGAIYSAANFIVLDADNSMPVPGATISINGVPVGSTDSIGYFGLRGVINSSDVLGISSVGYVEKNIAVSTLIASGGDDYPAVFLNKDLVNLPGVTVSSKKTNWLTYLIIGGLAYALLK